MIENFYPTPKSLIKKILEGIKLGDVEEILDLGAGKGDIADYVVEEKRRKDYHGYARIKVDVVEINPDLQHILRGKGYRLVHDDILTFETHKVYDLIIANFPFDIGAECLQKALSLLEKNGGQLSCVVNAETLKHTYTRLRQTIKHKLEKLGAAIEYLDGEFEDAERETHVEIALIKLKLERPDVPSVILDDLKRADEVRVQTEGQYQLVSNDFMQALVSRFDMECRCGVRLIEEYYSLLPFVSTHFQRVGEERRFTKGLIELKIEGAHNTPASCVNSYLEGVRHKYWELLINDARFNSFYTSNILKELSSKLTELKGYDFSMFNISELIKEMSAKITAGIEESILKLFDEFSRKYTYHEGIQDGNIHYYNGWKRNKAHRVNRRIIVPINGFSAYSKDKLDYNIHEKLIDMAKVFNYLSDDKADVKQLVGDACSQANARQDFSKVDLRYFEITFYKKGTCHITFKNERLLAKFNIFGSQRKGWLPPGYGKKAYSEMDAEESEVIYEFQGKEAYEEVVEHSDYYIVETTTTLQLTGASNALQAQ